MIINFEKQSAVTGGSMVVFAAQGGALLEGAARLDRAAAGQLRRACEASRFSGAFAEICEVLAPSGVAAARVLVVGIGNMKKAGVSELEHLGGAVCARALGTGDATLLIDAAGLTCAALDEAEIAARIAFGARLRAYRFDRYRTSPAGDRAKSTLDTITILTPNVRSSQAHFKRLEALASGIFMARDLVSEPANKLFPKEFAERIRGLEQHGVSVQVLGEKKLKELGFGALLGVSQGSTFEPQVVVCEYDGSGPKGKKARSARGSAGQPVVLAGKGVTFDAGGINIKPTAGLETLKMDMGGAAAVVGAIKTLALRKARCHVVGICGLVENMPSGNAQRPGDVVTSLSGKTIEVINTDAEGRLVLCDILWYAQQRYRPKVIVDMATLTGAIVIALGQDYAGLFCNDDGLAAQLIGAGSATSDRLWQFPMGEAYDKHLDSLIADVKNLGPNEGRSIIAAQFIKRFVQEGVSWAHVDFGGMVWKDEDTSLSPKGATGFGVRLLDEWIATHHERS